MYQWLLIPAVGTILAITFLTRAAANRGFNAAPLVLMSHLICAVIMSAAAVLGADGASVRQTLAPDTIWVPLLGGASSALGTCCTFAALRQRATGPVTTITFMSIIVPIAVATGLNWDRKLETLTVIGALLAFAGALAIHWGKAPKLQSERFHWLWLALAAMFLFGFSQTAQKFITVLHPSADPMPRWVFMASYYLFSVLTMLLYMLLTGRGLQFHALGYAGGIALGSMVQFLCILPLLEHVPTAVVYITFSGGGVILVTIVSTLWLGERYRPLVWVGCVLGTAGIIFMRLQ